jgi:hypothetical protein
MERTINFAKAMTTYQMSSPQTTTLHPHAPQNKLKLLDQLRAALRTRHYSRRTEEVYALWVKRYCRFHGLRHPSEMSETEINAFLTHLALEEKVSAST